MTTDPEPFEALLLEQARLCHAELRNSVKSLRAFGKAHPLDDRILSPSAALTTDLLVQHVSQLADVTTRLAATAARIRGKPAAKDD
ncbi:MAG TPA: hypothetical protein VGG10_05100 [Rhizomicrobium sp.]|jgi:hypothetical protein